jgi:PIN domain nuclease of toxin-antitoxin system
VNVLLDTHSFIWFNLNDLRLTATARQVIEDAANEVMISPASYWEIAIKISKGKFTLAATYDVFWQSGIDANAFRILPIEVRHTSHLISLPFHHKDPFDRLLLAQALVEQIPLVSGDAMLDAYGIKRIW